MEMNEQMIKKTLDDVTSSVKFLCEEDLNYLQTSSKLEVLNQKMSELQTLVVYSEDKSFVNTVCAMQIITNNFNDEIMKEFGKSFSKDFKEHQLNFLRNTSNTFDILVNDVENIPSSKEEYQEEKSKEFNKKVKETKKEYEKKSTKEIVNDIIKKTNEKLDSYFESEKDLKEYLSYMSKFHNYSIGNCSLIESQFSGASAVGSYKFWKDNGFPVNKGEKGIQILVPTPIKRFKDENGELQYISKATKEQKEKIKKGELETYNKMGYKQGYVFDVSQTNAKAEDLPKIFPNRWLEGEVADYDTLYKAIENIANKIDVKIIEPKQELGVAKGVSYTLTKEVALNPRNSQLQNVKTLLHELAHAKLHTFDKIDQYSKEEKEFQAEMVAYSVCSYFGIDTSDYSLQYLNHYTKDSDIKEKKKLLNEIKNTSSEFIEIIEETLAKELESKLEKEIQINKDLKQALKEENQIYTKFVWSEHNEIEDGSVYEFEDANEFIKVLNNINKANGVPGYDKTKFELYFDKECTDKFYTGRFDIGNDYGEDLKTHIYKHMNEYQKEYNLSDNKKHALFETLGIEDSKPKVKKEKSKEKEYSV